jgi:penicillin-binding protein 2A
LDSVGLKKSREILTRLGINIHNSDMNLSLALGALKNGAKVLDIVSAYSTIANNGNYQQLSFVDKILDENDNIIYAHEDFSQQVID